MKKCPQCSRTYADETLSFCLEDGALLSAAYDPQETNSPTSVLNFAEAPTVAAREVETVVVDKPVPTVAGAPRLTEQQNDPKVRWYKYLPGVVLAFIISFVLSQYLFDAASRFILESFDGALKTRMMNDMNSYILTSLALRTILSMIFYGATALILALVWPQAKWKWGLAAALPDLLPTADFIMFYAKNNFVPYILAELLKLAFIIFFACAMSLLASRLSNKIFHKSAA